MCTVVECDVDSLAIAASKPVSLKQSILLCYLSLWNRLRLASRCCILEGWRIMASSQTQETSTQAGRPEGHPSADLFVENKRLLDKRFKDLEDMFMARSAGAFQRGRSLITVAL